MRILAVVNVKDIPDAELLVKSGGDLCHFFNKMIGTVSPGELLKESDAIEVDFGEMGIRFIPKSKMNIFGDMSEE